MNILKHLFKYLTGQQFTLYMGGGGSGGSGTGTQTNISELPEWARGYAKDTLEKGAALTEKPYQAYDQPRIAGFSPMQQQAQQGAANMQTSAGTQAGLDVAGAAAMGGLNQNYQAGQFQGGQFGNRQAAQYMSPFIQQSLQPQLREAQRASEMQGQQNAAQAVGRGAFGGSRSGLLEAERQRNLAIQQGDIQARGLQDAYTQAQNQFNADQARRMQAQQLGEQSRQFGANLGLQGLNTALQGAGQLGALGQQQFQQGMDINKLQSAYGGQQQALQQQGLTQAYQDFQNQQNYPYKQLGFMSDLIRGMPLGQSTTRTMYEPEPSMAQQAGSLGLGLYGLSKFMASGGMAYADGGSVESQSNIQSIVSKLSDQQLQQAAQAAQARGDKDEFEAIQSEMAMRASERNGLASAVTPEMADQMANGGIVAFSTGGLNDTLSKLDALAGTDLSESPEKRMAGISAMLPSVQALYGPSALAPFKEDFKTERTNIGKMSDEGIGLGALAASQALLRPGSKSRAGAAAMGAFGAEVVKMKKEQREAERQLRQAEITLASAEQARADGQIGKAQELYKQSQDQKEKGLDRQIGVLEKKATIEGGIKQAQIGAGRATDLDKLTAAQHAAMLEAGAPDNAATRVAASEKAANIYGKMAGSARAGIAETTAREKAADKVDTARYQDPVWRDAKKNKDNAGMRAREEEMIQERMGKSSQGGNAPQTVTIGNQTYARPAGFTDAQWEAYKQSQGVK